MAKARTVSKADLVSKVAESKGLRKKDVKDIMDAVLEQISASLDKGAKVQLTGFGTFEVREQVPGLQARQGPQGPRPPLTPRTEQHRGPLARSGPLRLGRRPVGALPTGASRARR